MVLSSVLSGRASVHLVVEYGQGVSDVAGIATLLSDEASAMAAFVQLYSSKTEISAADRGSG
eukprot:COSAG02_NODE_1874_length_10576_cov_8.410614_8_plen_62_part_00